MAISIPKRSEWQTFKDGFGIPKGAVSGINVGDELDRWHNGMSRDFKRNAELARALENKLAEYLRRLDAKKVTKRSHSDFKSEFTTKYVLMANRVVEEMSAMAGEREAYKGRLELLWREAGRMRKGVTLSTLQTFRSGAVRGQLAVAANVKGYDPKDQIQLWKGIDDTINNLNSSHPQATLDEVARLIEVTLTKSKELARSSGLVS
jgi:hypothetical protein